MIYAVKVNDTERLVEARSPAQAKALAVKSMVRIECREANEIDLAWHRIHERDVIHAKVVAA